MLRRWTFSSLRFQIILALAILVITAVMLMGFLITFTSRQILMEEKRRLGQATAALIQHALNSPTPAESAAGEDGVRRLIQRVASQFQDRSYYHSITFFNHANRVMWSTLPKARWPYALVFSGGMPNPLGALMINADKDPATGENVMVVAFPWKVAGRSFGTVQLIEPIISHSEEWLFSGKLIFAFAGGYAIIVILFGLALLTQMVVSPVNRLNQAVRRLAQGERTIWLPEEERNELGELSRNVNELARLLAENEMRMSDQIEELLEVNEELELTRRSLIRSEKMASIGRLASGVAHEVGNPLSAIIGYIDILRAGGVDEAMQTDFLDRISKDITRINTIIRGLLDYSRQTQEKIETVDLNVLISDTFDLVRHQKQFKGVEFEVASHLVPAYAAVDSSQFQQVLVNLFINAAHAMDGDGAISVFVERVEFDPSFTYRRSANAFRRGQSLVAIAVMDTGMGMNEETAANIFDPFFTTKEPGSGTGLGLSVSDKIIDGFGGTIEVDSQLGEGTTFTILLPEASIDSLGGEENVRIS